MSTDYEYVDQTSPPNTSEDGSPVQEPTEETPIEGRDLDSETAENPLGGSFTQPQPDYPERQGSILEPFVLLRSETNAFGGFDIVVPWLPAALFRSQKKPEDATATRKTLKDMGKRSLRVLSAAMVAHYYLQKDPALTMASVGAQVRELAFPVFAAYMAGVYLAPIGAVMYSLAGLKLLN